MSGFYCYICGKNTDETDLGGFLNSQPVCNESWNAIMKWKKRVVSDKERQEVNDLYGGSME